MYVLLVSLLATKTEGLRVGDLFFKALATIKAKNKAACLLAYRHFFLLVIYSWITFNQI